MVRLLLPLLLLVAGALVVALVRDRRKIQAPGGRLRLRLPAAWAGGFDEPTTASFDCGSGRRLRVELQGPSRSAWPAGRH